MNSGTGNKNLANWIPLAQVIWALGVAFALGMVYNDIQTIKATLAVGVYSKKEVDDRLGLLYDEVHLMQREYLDLLKARAAEADPKPKR